MRLIDISVPQRLRLPVAVPGEPVVPVVSVISGGAALSLRLYGPGSPGRGRWPGPGQAHTGPVRTAQAAIAAREDRLSMRIGQVPVDGVLAQHQPLGDVRVAQSLRDELEHVELVGRQLTLLRRL